MQDCETNDCRKEKRGCKGCYYENKNIDKDTELLKQIAEAIWCDGDVYLTENHKQAIENVLARLKDQEIVNCKILEEKVKIIIENRKIIDNLKAELETHKKIAEKLLDVTDEEKTEAYFQEYIGKNNEDYDEFDYFFEKARKEVEKDE